MTADGMKMEKDDEKQGEKENENVSICQMTKKIFIIKP